MTPWWEYHDRFLTEERVSQGAQFYIEHRGSLEKTAAARAIPPEYLVAILGVETKYGRITGKYRVLDALMTLAFDYPPRSEYFRGELEQFLLLYSEERIDPLKVTGSYAGAMGVPQFMPSSYRLFAVDGDGDRQRDLWNDWDDIFASIANYFVEHGWEAGGPVLAETRLDPEPKFQIDTRNLELNEDGREPECAGCHRYRGTDRHNPGRTDLRRATRRSGLPRRLQELLRHHTL